MLEGTRRSVLQAIVDRQATTSLKEVEDVELAEAIDLDLSLVRSALNDLAQAGYLRLERTEMLSGFCYSAAITPEGRVALQEAPQTRLEPEGSPSSK